MNARLSPLSTSEERALNMPAHQELVHRGFLKSCAAHGARPAVEVAGEVLTYAQLFHFAASLAATLERHANPSGPALTAVFAHRSAVAFAGVLGVLLHGNGYVPLNRTFPLERTRSVFQRSKCRSLVADEESEKQLDQLLTGIDYACLVILPERHDTHQLAMKWPLHRFIGATELEAHERWRFKGVSGDSLAYLLFTSGSTGTPKGVMVTHRNVRHYIDFTTQRLCVGPEDRLSQLFDLTFDLSVADMFVAWERGACVCCPSERMLINPGRFIQQARLTLWFSVPSTATFMKRLGALKAGMYPGLRVSMFCGEALPVAVAKAWAEAAPNSVVENIYGPTELTIACTHYRWDPAKSPSESLHGVVPIGEPFPGMRPLVVDASLKEVPPGADGELLMAGPQLASGYWDDPAKTSAAFLKPPAQSDIYYRSGDRVRRPVGQTPLLYLGRIDNQIKIRGHRVELGEIEAVVREESGVDGVVALGWPRDLSNADGVEVFLQSARLPPTAVKERVAARLPGYMVPRRYHCLPRLPLNSNGKYDRQSLTKYLEALP
jgi:amino acid adenylation domain-containing protein